MSIEVPADTEAQLREVAAKQGRDLHAVVEEAIRQYLESIAITDVDSASVAETQSALVSELPPKSRWKAPEA